MEWEVFDRFRIARLSNRMLVVDAVRILDRDASARKAGVATPTSVEVAAARRVVDGCSAERLADAESVYRLEREREHDDAVDVLAESMTLSRAFEIVGSGYPERDPVYPHPDVQDPDKCEAARRKVNWHYAATEPRRSMTEEQLAEELAAEDRFLRYCDEQDNAERGRREDRGIDREAEGWHQAQQQEWSRAGQESVAAGASDGPAGGGVDSVPVRRSVREVLLGQARWAYEHAELIECETGRMAEQGDISGAYEWGGQARILRNFARDFERDAQALGLDMDSEEDSPAARALVASLKKARWTHERALRIEREVYQHRGGVHAFERAGQARMLRDSARGFERDARTRAGAGASSDLVGHARGDTAASETPAASAPTTARAPKVGKGLSTGSGPADARAAAGSSWVRDEPAEVARSAQRLEQITDNAGDQVESPVSRAEASYYGRALEATSEPVVTGHNDTRRAEAAPADASSSASSSRAGRGVSMGFGFVGSPRSGSVEAGSSLSGVEQARSALSNLRAEQTNAAQDDRDQARANQVNLWAARPAADARDTGQSLGRE